jgi:hypothetical protein
VWLAPLAFALHVSKELPRFTTWVQRCINPAFTRQQYVRVQRRRFVGQRRPLTAFA